MFNFSKFNCLANTIKQVRGLSQLASSNISFKNINSQKFFLINSQINSKTNYICPSVKNFQLPINDFKITDIIKRHELTLPEINKNKIVYDPLLAFQIEKELPKFQKEINNSPMYCGKPLFSETKWRSRKMNIKKRKKYQKKMFYVIQKRKQAKEKRYNSLLEMYRSIHEKKTELFDPYRFINRELEKAKFFGFKCNQVYDQYRTVVNEKMKTFDEKYFKKFEDVKKPLHIKYEEELNNETKK